MAAIRRDLPRTVLAILFLLLLIGGSLWILWPFLAATIWAAMIVIATWPVFLSLEKRLGNRRGWAVTIMVLIMVLLLVLPFWLAVETLIGHVEDITGLAQRIFAGGTPSLPEWVVDLPLVGERIAAWWGQLADAGSQGLVAKVQPHMARFGKWALVRAGGLGAMLVQLFLVLILSAVFYAGGEEAAARVLRFGRRLAGERGENSVILAGQAIRGVALGVGVTALVQTLMGGIGLAIAGVPLASLLSAAMLMLCIAQVGPAPILFPAVGWLFWTGDTGWAIFLLVWSLITVTIDNFLRPVLIKTGADLPLLLIFAGVIGGMLGFGLIGIFVGPVVLAVTYTLLDAWLTDGLSNMEEG